MRTSLALAPVVRKNGSVYTAQMPTDSTAVMGRRFGAFFIDLILGGVVFIVAFMIFSDKAVGLARTVSCADIRKGGGTNLCFAMGDDIRYAENGKAASIYAVGIAFSFLNAAVLQASGGTIGKRVVGLAVVRQDSGQPLGFGKAIVRWLVSLFDVGCCFLIGLITALATKGHRRLADMAASSVVVAKSSVGTPPRYEGSPAAAPPMTWSPPGGGFGPPPGPGGYGAPPAPGQWAPPVPPADPWSPPAPPAGTWAPPAAPVDPWSQPVAPPADPWSQPISPAAPAWHVPAPPATAAVPAPPPEPVIEPVVAPPAAAEPAPGGPQWDAARNAYIQYEPVSGQWMQFDDAAQQWRPLS
jgi:uncharacterized RDD family membrane protein YckC